MNVRAFNVNIATASIPSNDSQAMHSDEEKNGKDIVMFGCWEWLAICKKKKGKWRLSRYDGLNKTYHSCIALSNRSFCLFKYPYLKRYTTLVANWSKVPTYGSNVKDWGRKPFKKSWQCWTKSRSSYPNFSFLWSYQKQTLYFAKHLILHKRNMIVMWLSNNSA